MNWKKEAMEKLHRYDAMHKAACNIPVELHRLQVAAYSAKAKGGEDQLLNNLVHQQELKWRLEQARCWLKVTDHALQTLDEEQRLILQRLFIYPEKGAVERLCQELGVEQSTVYRYREQALRLFTTALYGTLES